MFEQLEQGGGGSPTDAYTKAQTDALLSEKADKNLTYTKTETNTLLGAKANADSVYTKSETNAEIEGAITDLDVSSTATTGHYIDYISQEDGLIVPHAEAAATSVIPSSAKLITSGAVAAAGYITPTSYATQSTGGTAKIWTTTDGTDLILNIATE
jgi:hypothetical protein